MKNPRPTQLALLISLIGIGVSPAAFGRVEPRPVGTAPAWATTQAPAQMAEAMLDQGGPGVALGCQTPCSAFDPDALALIAALPIENDDAEAWGREAQRLTAPSVSTRPATASVIEKSRKAQAKRRRTHLMVQAPSAAVRKLYESFALGRREVERSVRAEQITPVSEAVMPTVASVSVSAPAPSDEVMTSLAAVLLEPMPEPGPATREEPAATSIGTVARMPEGAAARAELAPLATESESSKVLRSLGVIVSEDNSAAQVSESDKVMSTLAGKSSAASESGPEKRLRKLAAKAAAEAAAQAATAAAPATAAAAPATALMPATAAQPATSIATTTAASSAQPETASVNEVPEAAPTAAPEPVADVSPPPARHGNAFGSQAVAVADQSLDRVRGGFDVGGLNISFGIERAVYVNGALVTTTSLNVSDLGRITAGRGTSMDLATLGLIQSGTGNVIAPTSISTGAIGTVIQNTLDGQKIQNVTTINASVNSLGVLKGLSLQSSLRGAVIDSLRR